MSLTKGQFVRHPKDEVHEKWGYGIVLDDEKNNQVPVFFEHNSARKTIGTQVAQLEVVDDPGKAAVFLQHALYEDVGDRQPFPIVLEKFLMNFPGGLKGEFYLSEERNYKLEASQLAKELLSEDRFSQLIESGDLETLAADIKKIFSKTNLLASFEMIKLNDALKKPEDIQAVSKAFFELVYGKNKVEQRIESASNQLEKFELNKWPILTYLLFLIYPDSCMFVKPTMTKEAAENRGFDIQYDSKVNANTYQRVLLFSKDLFERLSQDSRLELHPLDMIDVQGFMWCTFTSAYSSLELPSK